jgi:hypothetical protein
MLKGYKLYESKFKIKFGAELSCSHTLHSSRSVKDHFQRFVAEKEWWVTAYVGRKIKYIVLMQSWILKMISFFPPGKWIGR